MHTLSLPHTPDLLALAAAEPAHFPCLLQSAGSQGWDILAAFPEDVRVYGAGQAADLAADLATDLATDPVTEPVTEPITEPGLEVSAQPDEASGATHSAPGLALADSGAAEAEEETEALAEAVAIAPADPDQSPALEVLAPSLPIQALQQSSLLLEPGLSLSPEPASAGLPPVTPVEHA